MRPYLVDREDAIEILSSVLKVELESNPSYRDKFAHVIRAKFEDMNVLYSLDLPEWWYKMRAYFDLTAEDLI